MNRSTENTMPYLNSGSSIYHEIHALYWRSTDGNLLAIEGHHTDRVREAWSQIWTEIEAHSEESAKIVLSSGGWLRTTQLTPPHSDHDSRAASLLLKDSEAGVLQIREMCRPGNKDVIGIVSIVPASGHQTTELRDWMCRFILAETQFLPLRRLQGSADDDLEVLDMARRITEIFEKELRNVTDEDQWIVGGGRDYFIDRVFGFTQRRARVQMCLPAFPCKSSNRQKSIGASPDRAEAIALEMLHSFSCQVAAIYAPGVKISIISDGHVFSDCIGVDDDVVAIYGQELQEMEQQMTGHLDDKSPIEFVSLWSIFFSKPAITGLFKSSMVEEVDMPHFVQTKLTDEAELCRQVLMASCGVSPEGLRDLINGDDQGTVALYRGFSRFMLEDLATHPSCMGKSVSQRKKIAAKVAREMIKRNQAYSNLVQLLYPSHLRLSIHAHNNRGPKFGIRLFPTPKVRVIRSMEDRKEPPTQDLLHTPTPWHNCIIEVKGDPTLYLAKSRVALEALGDNRYEGGCESSDCGVKGRCFALSETQSYFSQNGSSDVASLSTPRL